MPASGHAPKSFAQPKAMEPIELLCLEDNTTQVHSSVGIDTPLFQPYPTEVRFRDYAPFSCIERTLRFRNNDHVARRIKVLQPKSPYFEVSGPHARGKDVTLKQSKVATGMEVCFVVKFRPQEVREYKVDLVCCTEREKFIVPVRAFGLPWACRRTRRSCPAAPAPRASPTKLVSIEWAERAARVRCDHGFLHARAASLSRMMPSATGHGSRRRARPRVPDGRPVAPGGRAGEGRGRSQSGAASGRRPHRTGPQSTAGRLARRGDGDLLARAFAPSVTSWLSLTRTFLPRAEQSIC